jgi:hypothetical protein
MNKILVRAAASCAFFGLMAACKPSPHGGYVPIWQDTANRHRVSGGDGSSLERAVFFSNGSLGAAEGYEIGWLGAHEINEKYTRERIYAGGRTYDVLRLNAEPKRAIYFDVTELRH